MAKTNSEFMISAISINGGYSVAFYLENEWKPMGPSFETFEEADAAAKKKAERYNNEYISMR